ncbi:hypothetical protein CN491_13560 [Bacillus cereus]|uniref:Uncharacterized protein n=1 Tax=Bacillus cereus TaxID=1396 RepID=A0A2A8LQF4_BACCE|nr:MULTISPECIES: DUF188 domain-containing protein [Bacillus cereus group]MDR4983055.1 DUF188 domain-containing protein [Bacillus cereus]MEA1008475.1 DUF188 domain-containing protein [Bacillus cereus]PES95886.1 hypothetical protein CN491_13560 [Bacillus cereus]PFP75118.1 hypothetical protein COJ95_19030 [Bacillus cereus]
MKTKIVQVETETYVKILFVTSYTHRSRKQQGNWIYVDSEQDKVDFYINQHVKVTDLVITQEMGLASLFVTDEPMNTILYSKHVSAKLRREGTDTKGPKSFAIRDRQHFLTSLEKILSNYKGIF